MTQEELKKDIATLKILIKKGEEYAEAGFDNELQNDLNKTLLAELEKKVKED